MIDSFLEEFVVLYINSSLLSLICQQVVTKTRIWMFLRECLLMNEDGEKEEWAKG